MSIFRRIQSSIIVQVTTFTIAALVFLFLFFVTLMQTVFSPAIYKVALEDNGGSIAELVWLVENSPEELYPFILSSYHSGSRQATIAAAFEPGLEPRASMKRLLLEAESDVAEQLKTRDIKFEQIGRSTLRERLDGKSLRGMRGATALHIAIELKNDRVLNVWLAPSVTLATRPAPIMFGMVAIISVAVGLGLALSWIILRPLRQLERDADQIDLAETGNPVPEIGPLEVRRLSAALNRMRSRLASLIQERELIIAAIAHDVRTGLHRIRLRMDEPADFTPEAIASDMSQMEALISDMLAYARAESPEGPRELIDLTKFLQTISESAPHPVSFSCLGPKFEIAADPVALRRMFENLLENARRYGAGEISIDVSYSHRGLRVAVNDNGPGLPDNELEAMFEPFKRGEQSRNRETGGAGLGLGISRAIARAHGASVRLENRPSGGLAAIVEFPESLRT